MRLVFDLESDGLLDTVTKIHCISAVDIDTEQSYSFGPDQIDEGVRLLESAETIVAHNYIGYDRKVLKKFYPNFREPKYHDTYILSQMFYANEMQFHSIDAWGRYFHRPKPKHEEWDVFSPEMLHRCQEDTQILLKLFKMLNSNERLDRYKKPVALEYRVYEIDSEYEYWFIDVPKLVHWTRRLSILRDGLRARLVKMAGPQPRDTGGFNKIFKKDGNLKKLVVDYAESTGMNLRTICGDFSKVDWEDINPKSSKQMVKWLLNAGWIPDEFNYKRDSRGRMMKDANDQPIVSSPKLTGEFRGVEEGLGALLRKFNQVSQRLSVLEGYANKQVDGKIPTFAYTCGTNTARYRHRGVVNVPKAEKTVYMGRMMRSLFVAPKGYVLVGCDASQLESRIEGHYTTRYDGGEYADILLNSDVHQKTADELGLTRSEGKTLNYALQYGASAGKIMKMLEISLPEAKELVNLYWNMRPASTALKKDIETSLVNRGYHRKDDLYNTRAFVKTIDKRPIFVRSWHSLVNSLIQSTGMICMKVALCMAHKEINRLGIRARLAIMYHDEYQWICKPEDAERLSEILIESIRKAGEHYNLNVPLEAEAKIGNNWRSTH